MTTPSQHAFEVIRTRYAGGRRLPPRRLSPWRAALVALMTVVLLTAGATPVTAAGRLFGTSPPVTVAETRTVDHPALLVNRNRPISPSGYVPANLTDIHGARLVRPAAAATRDLIAAAGRAGHSVRVVSGYRSYSYQRALYDSYVAKYGRDYADRIAARPGTSEHQLGLAVDVGSLSSSFGSSPAGRWVAAHAPEFGFIIRYPADGEAITGYTYEPWHLRYLGPELAGHFTDSGYPTYEQYVAALEKWEATPRADIVDHTFERSINWLYGQGITGGYSNGHFGPDDRVTRLEMAAFLYRYAGRYDFSGTGTAPAEPPYAGIPVTHSYAEELGWVRVKRIAGGYTDGTFGTGDPITRGQLAAFLMNYVKNVHGLADDYAPPRTSPFSDVNAGGAHYEAISWLASSRITGGFADGAFRPWRPTKRGEMAAFLHRLDTYVAARSDG